jgi:hypothetical protein
MSEQDNDYSIGAVKEFDIAGENVHYQEHGMTNYGDLVFHKTGFKVSKNMDKLWRHFHYKQKYPKYYLGIAEKVAICECPTMGLEEWYNSARYLSLQNPKKGDTIVVTKIVKGKSYMREYVFVGWVKQPVHEWTMDDNSMLYLEQSYVDGLFQAEKRQLKINR